MATRKSDKNEKNNLPFTIMIVMAGIAVAAFIAQSGWDPISDFFGLNEKPAANRPAEGTVQVHFIDVGQGDCALILTNEKTVLIDSGDRDYADRVIQYIKRMEIETIDLIIVSHLHADHMGGMDKIIAAVDTDTLMMPKIPDSLVPTTNVFINMIAAIEEHSVNAVYADTGGVIDLGGAFMEILAPDPDFKFNDMNNSSIIAKLIHGKNSFLFTGDIEQEAEKDILSRGKNISAVVLKVAHHGSNTSSSRGFLEKAGGKYAVIGVGSPNNYNHPGSDTVKRLTETGYDILRTDEMGTIVFESNPDGVLNITHTKKLEDAA